MPSFRFILTAALIATLGIHSASALEIDDTGSSNPAAANLTDPDDKMPVAHLGDNGVPQQGTTSGFKFQMQGGSNGFSNNSGPSLFDRAQQNQMGQ